MPPLSLLMLLHPSQSQSQSSLSSDESPPSERRFRSCSVGSSAEFICTNTTTTSTTMMTMTMPKAPTLSSCSCSSPPPPPLPLPSSSSTIVMNDNTNHDNDNDNTNSEHEEEEHEEEEAIEDQQQEEQQQEQEEEEQQNQERKGKGKQHISFNPQVLVIQPLYMENKKQKGKKQQQVQQQVQQPCDKSQCWYSEKDIDNFQKHAFFTIRRFQRNWRLNEEDCLRGLESQTTKYTATKVRINVYKDLILAKKEISKRMLANSPVKTKHMISLILGASTQDALELAKKDAEAAQRYQQEIVSIPPPPQQNQEKDQAFKCFFFDFSKWLGNANKSPAIVDLPMI